MSSHCVVNSTKIKSLSVQTQLNSIYYIQLCVLIYPSYDQLWTGGWPDIGWNM